MKRCGFTDIQQERILEMVRAGAYVSVVEKRMGLSRNMLWGRIHQAELPNAHPDDASFAVDFRKAEAEAETTLVDRLRSAAADDPKWAAWLLERRFPKRWAGRSEAERERAEPEKKNVTNLDDARARVKAARKAGAK